jgi:hypothetical protein
MATDAEGQCVGCFHGRIETAPENYTENKEGKGSGYSCAKHQLAGKKAFLV